MDRQSKQVRLVEQLRGLRITTLVILLMSVTISVIWLRSDLAALSVLVLLQVGAMGLVWFGVSLSLEELGDLGAVEDQGQEPEYPGAMTHMPPMRKLDPDPKRVDVPIVES